MRTPLGCTCRPGDVEPCPACQAVIDDAEADHHDHTGGWPQVDLEREADRDAARWERHFWGHG